MSAMEQSLRRALEAGDGSDPAFRESIYSASERALERLLAAKGTGEDAAEAQRIRLAETINRVEEDYFASFPVPEEPSSDDETGLGRTGWAEQEAIDAADRFEEPGDEVPAHRDPKRDEDDGGYAHAGLDPSPEEQDDRIGRAGGFSPGGRAAGRYDPAPAPLVASSRDDGTWSPGKERRDAKKSVRNRRRLRPFLFGLVVLLIALALGGYLYTSLVGPLPFLDRATGGSSAASGAEAGEWINLFDGTRLEAISTPNGGRVEAIAGAGDRPGVRIASAAKGGEIEIQIGPGVVAETLGRKLRVEILAGSSDGAGREFGVRCLFGGVTACGRQRFKTLQSSEPFVFDMEIPANAPTAGTIAIEPGFGTASKDLDLYSVRLRPVAGS